MTSWYSTEGKDCDVALYTKITLSRNIKGFSFPNRMSDEQRENAMELILDALNSDEAFADNYTVFNYIDLSENTLMALKERGLINEGFSSVALNKKLILSKDENVSIMLCNEDHIKVTVHYAGMAFEEAYKLSEEIDSLICSALPIAFDDRLGFLTESPMELGTGLTAEVLLHLPSIEAAGEIRSIADSVSRIGFSIKGITDDDGYNVTSFYRLTNLITLGITENAAIENIASIAVQIINRERASRDVVDRIDVEDAVFRAVALLKSARKLDVNETERLISQLKTGISCGIIKNVQHHVPYEILINSQEGMIKSAYGKMSACEVDVSRAEYIRRALSDINI